MDTAYWNKVAKQYDSEIFSVLANDKSNLISTRIKEFASGTKTASDLGCGIGKFLPLLSQSFRHVYAYDISGICLKQARENSADLSNVDYIRADLSIQKKSKPPKVDFILCVNSIIMPSMLKRSRYFRAIRNHLNHGGQLVLVVPSFESAIFSSIRMIECEMRRGHSYGGAVMSLLNCNNREKASHLRQGILNIDNVPTKHYLKEELCTILHGLNFEIDEISKIEYDWTTEFNNPPRWLKEPFPWDWLVTARR